MSRTSSGISRRDFMQGVAAGALAAPLIMSQTAFGADEKPAANERITLGFIGVGKQSRGHLMHYLGQKECQVLAVCDVDTKRREDAKKRVEDRYGKENKSGTYKGCAAYNDFRELIARKDIDAVVIGTPDHWHAIPVIEACKAKKDIYCEKPLTLTIKEAKVLIDVVRKYDRVFQTGSQQRSDNKDQFLKACEYVRNGRLGKIKLVTVNVGATSKPCNLPEEKLEEGLDWNMWLGCAPMRPYNSILSPRGIHDNFPDWRLYREYSGGYVTDWGAHHFDIAQWGLGMDESGPVEIIPPDDPKATKGVKFIYANGVEMIHGDLPKFNSLRFTGTEGEITVDRGSIESNPASILKEPLGDKAVRLYASPGHHKDWINCIKSRKRPICDVEIGARSATVCHLGNIAYWTHKKFKWDPKEWKFVDADPEVAKWFDRDRREPWQLPKV